MMSFRNGGGGEDVRVEEPPFQGDLREEGQLRGGVPD